MASRPFLLLKPMPPLRTLVALCVTLTACRPGYRHKLSGELQQALAAGPADTLVPFAEELPEPVVDS